MGSQYLRQCYGGRVPNPLSLCDSWSRYFTGVIPIRQCQLKLKEDTLHILYYDKTDTHLTASLPGNLEKPAPERLNHSGF